MNVLLLTVIFIILALAHTEPTTESTHNLLKRLGFDPVQKLPVNHHTKRVALETNKARYHNDIYNSDTDSRMFVVKLPPHSPYYSHMKPEKFRNERPPKPPASFRTNGKPGRIYHWNIPIIKRMTQTKKKGVVRSATEDSKIYHLKILPNHVQKYQSHQESHKNNNSKHKKHKYEERITMAKPNKYHRNKFYRFTNTLNSSQNTLPLEQEFIHSQNITADENSNNRLNDRLKSKNYLNKKSDDMYTNEVSKIKSKHSGPNIYMPAIPKHNSFYKYFTGNGKPKSFYVIEKSKKASRLHRLL